MTEYFRVRKTAILVTGNGPYYRPLLEMERCADDAEILLLPRFEIHVLVSREKRELRFNHSRAIKWELPGLSPLAY